MISLRFPSELEEKLDELSNLENRTKTDILKESFLMYIQNKGAEKSAYQLGKKYFGKYNSGINDKSVNHKQHIREKIKAKIHA